jgi:hypothetical protein
MLFGDEASTNPCTKMLVKESGNLCWVDVFSTLKKALREDGNGVGMSADQVGHYFSELHLLLYGGNGSLVEGFERGERVEIVVVDLGDIGIRNDYKG